MSAQGVPVVAIIQARMGSTRLPGKVLHDVGGQTMLARVVRRTQRARRLDELVVATTHRPEDDCVSAEADALGVRVFRGSDEDVLDRYYRAAAAVAAQVVVRITSDCPMIDPRLVDDVIEAFCRERPDYASNILVRTFPRGLDTEVMSLETLERAWTQATKREERAHVTPFVYGHPELFRLLSIRGDVDHSAHRWTVDTPEDLELVRALYARLGNGDGFSWHDALRLAEADLQLVEINRHVQQKPADKI